MRLSTAVFLALLSCWTGVATCDDPAPEGKTLAQWIAQLKDPDTQTREKAANVLRRVGPPAKAAVPALLEILRSDPVPELKMDAADTLGAIGDAAAVPALTEAMADPALHTVVARALVGFGPQAAAAVPALVAALEDDSIEEQRRRHHADFGDKTADYLVNPAVEALGAIGPKAVAPLLVALVSEKSAVRYRAAWALGEIGIVSGPGVAALTHALKDKDTIVRAYAASALGRVAWEAVELGPPLVEALKDAEWSVRWRAAGALGALGPRAVPIIAPALVQALADPDRDVGGAASEALARLGPEVVPLVIGAFRSPEAPIRIRAAHALEWLGPAAKAAIPALVQALSDDGLEWTDMMDPEQTPTNAAVDALARIGAEAVPPLVEALANGDPRVRARAAWALGRTGDAAKAAVPALERAAKDSDDSVRRRAADAIWAIRNR